MLCRIPKRAFLDGFRIVILGVVYLSIVLSLSHAHEGQHDFAHRKVLVKSGAGKSEANRYFKVFTSLVAKWPLPCRDSLIEQAALEHQFLHDDPKAIDLTTLRVRRQKLLKQLTSLLPTYQLRFKESGGELVDSRKPISVCPDIPSVILVKCNNQSSKTLVVRASYSFDDQANTVPAIVSPGSDALLSYPVSVKDSDQLPAAFKLQTQTTGGQGKSSLSIPVRRVSPAILQVRLTNKDGPRSKDVPGRISVQCSDGVCRYGGRYAAKSTFTDKPIIYPPIGTWQKLPFFYCDQLVEMKVPPGLTRVVFERGFEHRRETVEVMLKPGETEKVERACKQLINMSAQGWVSGDTHVHWVTNAWNVDEPLELLSMAQRAEDLKVVNNLTLLQRYANQAFVKPSQAPMGPVLKYSDSRFHVQMGEEYRNEDLYGHLCFLNIDWLVQPIGTGAIIAGPDALDYPINRTAIEACRIQGGINIEAHGTGGNKDVPVNVIHHLTDSLDQMEPGMYYKLLDCGFRLPLTNGSDHPARTLGVARAYVKVDGEFSYDRWIDGIRNGRTFTTSGPLLFLKVNNVDIGDVIETSPKQQLRIKARVISRDPIGTFQIVSNGKILLTRDSTDTKLEVEITIPAKESRWIVARCSNRQDGREDFGFGNFNAITGPGVAHTSPVYVHVDGMPRFDPAAADFWRERMRRHTHDIRGRGRFADDSQRKEAVGYIEQGMNMFQDLKSQVKLARSKTESFAQSKLRLANVVRRMGTSASGFRFTKKVVGARSMEEMREALEPLIVLKGIVNSDSQLVLDSTVRQIELKQGRPQRFLVVTENQSGVTGPLQIHVYDQENESRDVAKWCSVQVVDSPFTSAVLTGATREYKVLEFMAREGGKREVKLAATIGKNAKGLAVSKTDRLMIDVKRRRRGSSKTVNK